MATRIERAGRLLGGMAAAATRRRGGGLRGAALGGLVLLVAAGCASQGAIDNPVVRRATWVDYISGGDIRRACQAKEPGTVGRYRFVEFRNRAEQVRVYDVYPEPDRDGARLEAQVLGGGGRIGSDTRLSLSDPLAPWQPVQATTHLRPETLAALNDAVEADGLGEPPPVDRTLASRSYFWLAAGCGAGHSFGFQAWEWPSARYKALTFPRLLYEADRTGVARHPFPETETRQVNYGDRTRQDRINSRDNYTHYDLIVQENGVAMGRVYMRNPGG